MKVNGTEWNRIKFTEKLDFMKFLNICTYSSSQPNSILRSILEYSGEGHGENVKLNLNTRNLHDHLVTTSGHLEESDHLKSSPVARWFLNMQKFSYEKMV